jgi:RNA polymerase sigma-70 factor (ECF subfamily)
VEIARWDETQLAQRCKDGSEAAFAELVHRHRPRLYTLAYRLVGDLDAAEDVVQETFVAAFRTIDRFEPRPTLAAWLNTICVRNAGRVVAKASSRPKSSLDLLMDEDAGNRFQAAVATDDGDPHLAAEAAELRREVADAIAMLPFKYRAAVVTRYVLGLDYAEAAASLELGLNTFKSNLLRGTKMLRELLADAADRVPETRPADEPALRPTPATAAAATVRLAPALEMPAMPATVAATASLSAPSASAARSVPRTYSEPRPRRFVDRVPQEKAARG